jgi:RNA polymerase sigma-70 factor (ECF subfamily)
LVDAFTTSVGTPAGSGGVPDAASFEDVLAKLHARGQAAHPTLVLADDVFAAHLGRCGLTPAAAPETHAEDLFLACACLRNVDGALERLQEAYRPRIAREINRLGRASAFRDEVEQRLWDALLVGSDAGPRLATYVGAGPLERWLGISAQRIALMIVRREGIEERVHDELAAQEHLLVHDPEMAAIKERYRGHFQRAIEAALGTLDPREKMIIRMNLIDGLTLERIAKVYGVHQTTVTRWLSDARDRVVADAKQRLRVELQVAPSEFDSLVRLLLSQLDLNLSKALGK